MQDTTVMIASTTVKSCVRYQWIESMGLTVRGKRKNNEPLSVTIEHFFNHFKKMERNETLAVKWYNQIDYNQTTREILRLQSDQQNSNETNPIERKKHKMRGILA